MTHRQVSIIVADDHEAYRKGLRAMLSEIPGFEVVAEAENGVALIEKCEAFKPDLVLVDLIMPVMNGYEATTILTQKMPGIVVLAVSMFDNDHSILKILLAGAKGFLRKEARSAEIVEAVNWVCTENKYYCGSKSETVLKVLKKYSWPNLPPDTTLFTKRELQVIQLLCEEYNSKEIGEMLFICPSTVSGYRSALLTKTDSKTTVGIIIYALNNGLYNDSAQK